MGNKSAAAIAVLSIILLTGCGGGATTASGTPTATPTPTPTRTALQTALWKCGLPQDLTGDNGHSLTVNAGLVSDTITMSNVSCLLKQTSVPDSVVSQMDETNALDGMQHATWGSMKATWSYHPDNGFDLILSDQ